MWTPALGRLVEMKKKIIIFLLLVFSLFISFLGFEIVNTNSFSEFKNFYSFFFVKTYFQTIKNMIYLSYCINVFFVVVLYIRSGIQPSAVTDITGQGFMKILFVGKLIYTGIPYKTSVDHRF